MRRSTRDPRKNRENGWALYGLMQALKAQGKNGDAGASRSKIQEGLGTCGCAADFVAVWAVSSDLLKSVSILPLGEGLGMRVLENLF